MLLPAFRRLLGRPHNTIASHQPQRDRRARPVVEALETRELLAAGLTASLENGLLRVVGTPERDWIVTRQQQDGQISVEGGVQILSGDQLLDSVPKQDVTRIELAGLGNDDYLALFGADAGSFTGGVMMSGGDGRDAIVVPAGVSLDADPADKLLGLAEYTADTLQHARFELLYKFRDEFGYVGHYDVQKGQTHGDGEGTLYTAIAAIGIATGNYHQDSWESAQANAVLEDLLGTLLTKSWGTRDGLGREHPIRHPNWFDYHEAGNILRNSPMTKDAFGAIIAAAHYAYDNPHSSQAVRELARNLVTKWSEYLVLNQWRTHSTFIAGEFDADGDRSKTIFNEHGKPRMALSVEGFMLFPHEIYAIQNVAADMGIPTSQWNAWGAMSVSFKQTLADVAAPYLGEAAGRGLDYILDRLKFGRDYDIKVNLGGREVSVLKGSFSIGIPEGTRDRIVTEFSRFVTDVIREGVRLNNFQDQGGDLIGLALNRVLDLLPDQLGKDSWRSVLTGAVQQVVPWLSYAGLIEAGTFIVTLQANKAMDKPQIDAYTLWSFAAEFETRPEMADLLKPFVQEYFSFLRGSDNPNSLWAWLAEDSGRVNEHLGLFESRMFAATPEGRLSSEFAYSSTKFNEFVSRSEDPNKLFPRLDFVVLQGLAEKGPPRAASDVVADWWQKFANAAEQAFNRLVASTKQAWDDLKKDLGRLAGALVNELGMGLGDVAGILYGISPNLGDVAGALYNNAGNLGKDLGQLANALWSVKQDLGQVAPALRSVGAGFGDIVTQLWDKAGQNLRNMAGALKAAGAGFGDIAAALWEKSGRNLSSIAGVLWGNGANLPEVVYTLNKSLGSSLGSIAHALRNGIGSSFTSIASALWNSGVGGFNSANLASYLSSAGARLPDIVYAINKGIGRSLGGVAWDLRNGIGSSFTSIASALWNSGVGGFNMGDLADALRAAGASFDTAVSALMGAFGYAYWDAYWIVM
jgi:hypothetical protein